MDISVLVLMAGSVAFITQYIMAISHLILSRNCTTFLDKLCSKRGRRDVFVLESFYPQINDAQGS